MPALWGDPSTCRGFLNLYKMKVKINQLNPNPYRDMENYPINREKVEALKASMEQTGFWDNILARPKPFFTMEVGQVEYTGAEYILVPGYIGVRFWDRDITNEKDPLYNKYLSIECEKHKKAFAALEEHEGMQMCMADWRGEEEYGVIYDRDNAGEEEEGPDSGAINNDKEPIFELAYGHHRWVALKEMLSQDNTIDIPVKDISDASMLKIMAKENDNEWETNIAVTDETVRQTRKFLKEHPEEIKTKKPKDYKSSNIGIGKGYMLSPEAFQIAEFLDWGEQKVYNSLVRIGMIEDGEVEKDVIERMPTAKAADRFVSAVRAAKKSGKPIDIEKQRQVVERLKKEDNFSDRGIREEIIRESWEQPKKKVIDYERREKIQKYDSFLVDVRESVDECLEQLRKLVRIEIELQPDQTAQRMLLNMSLKSLHKQIELLIKTNENEKVEFRNTDPASIEG